MSEGNNANGTTAVNVTFDTSATGDAQNEVAKLLKDQGINITYTSTLDSNSSTYTNSASVKLNGTDEYSVTAADGNTFNIKDSQGQKIATITLTNDKIGKSKDTANEGSENITATSVTAGYKDGESIKYYDKDGNGIPENALDKYFSATTDNGTVTASAISGAKVYDALGNAIDADADDIKANQDLTGALKLTLHVGADATSNNQITVNLDAMSAKGLGVNGLKVDGADDTNALNAIETIKEAIQKVSTQRSALGAAQNRLEHTISNLDNVVENTTSAESAIRDTDMATEMVTYSNNNILAQAGQAMLAQANQSNQGVLSLLS